MQTVHLDANQVPSQLRGGYNGKKFKAVVCEETYIPADAGLWSGGSRDMYYAIDFNSGAQRELPNQHTAPWNSVRKEVQVKLQPGFALVRHSFFCGKDMGLTFYVHPDNATKLLPAPVDLGAVQKLVLEYTAHRKSSYMGKDRYAMAQDDARYGYGEMRKCSGITKENFPTREQWDVAKAELFSKGMLNKAGAITPKGRNAVD